MPHTIRAAFWAGLFLAAACGTDAPPTVEERAAAVLAASAQSGAAGADALVSSGDPVEVELVMRAVAEADVDQLALICPELKDPALAEDCQRRARRPHLSTSVPAHVPGGGAAAQAAGLPSPLTPPASFDAIALDTAPDRTSTVGPCQDDELPLACASRLRDTQAYGRGAQGVYDACSRVEAGTWRSECLLQGATVLIFADGAAKLRDATDLCSQTGEVMPTCMHHVVESLVKRVDRVDSGLSIPALTRLSQALRAEWAERDPAFGARLEDLAWSIATWGIASGTEQPEQALAGPWPPGAVQHVRAALAHRMVALRRPGAGDLPQTMQALQAAEAAALAAPAPTPPPRMAPANDPAQDLWTGTDGAEGATATFYLGTSQRWTIADPAIDRELAVVEASARSAFAKPVLEQASRSDHAIVRQTAERLERSLAVQVRAGHR